MLRGILLPENIRKAYNVLEWVALAGLLIYLGDRTLPHAWRTLNTDFPNYYLTARLLHEKFDTTRIYEWVWLARQKDHRAIDQGIVGMISLTPISTLLVSPFASMPSLTAKHYWIFLNSILLIFVIILLRRITYSPWRRVLLIVILSFPLHRNILFGQYYILLLFDLSLACWLYLSHRKFTSGIMLGIGFGLKIFPLLYLLYFLRKKDFVAFAGGVVSCIVAVAISLLVFGSQVNRTYMLDVVPWALRGEGLNPYNLTASSFASLLHRLFIYEPQWNPNPALNSPWLFALMHPILEMAILISVLLLSSSVVKSSRQIRLEWAAMLLAILTISTIPASYLFTLLILPVCLLWRSLETKRQYFAIAILLFFYCIAGLPVLMRPQWSGWQTLLGVPRLYALIGLFALVCAFLWRQAGIREHFGRTEMAWASGMAIVLTVSISAGLRHQKGLYKDYAFRIMMPPTAFMVADPQIHGSRISYIAMLPGSYRNAVEEHGIAHFDRGRFDQLSQTTSTGKQWIEEAGLESNVVVANTDRVEIANAEHPVASPDGTSIAFLREEKGRASLWLHRVADDANRDRRLTFADNVLEMSFLNDDRLVFAAASEAKFSRLYTIDTNGIVGILVTDESRYPTVSPDGKWLAYSRMEGGSWNLWIREINTGQSIPITAADCNHIEPAWDIDSMTLIYASDCGRSLWFTALYKRRVIP